MFQNTDDVKVKTGSGPARLAGVWKREVSRPPNTCLRRRPRSSFPPIRQAALESLRGIGGKDVIAGLQSLITGTPAMSISVRREAVLALAALGLRNGRKKPMLETLHDLKQESEARWTYYGVYLLGDQRRVSTTLGKKSLPKTGLSPVMAKAGLRVAREGGRNEPDLVVALTRGADLESAGLGLTDAEMKEIAVRAAHDGNAARGETIFRRKDISCLSCHAIGGAGGKVGPDLTSIGASAPVDYLIESVFYPNRKIKEGYHSILIETKDGDEFSGILVRENSEQLVLRKRRLTRKSRSPRTISRPAPWAIPSCLPAWWIP